MKLKLENISKIYGSTPTLQKIDLTLTSGVYGLLGPNGAGKTTLLRIIANILAPTSGRVSYDGEDISSMGERFRAKLGYLPQEFGYYPSFTAEQYLKYIGRLKGLDKRETQREAFRLLEKFGLLSLARKKMKNLSVGQRRRIGLAQALMGDPEILILDEPTVGLDPEERIKFRRMISSLSRERCVLFSTHIISDLETVADEMILLDQGKIIGCATPDRLLGELAGKVWSVRVSESEAMELMENYKYSKMIRDTDGYTLRVVSDSKPCETAELCAPNMEEMYLYFFS